jgi:hypothetical protein
MKKFYAISLILLLLCSYGLTFAQTSDGFTDAEWDVLESFRDNDLTDEEWKWFESYEKGELTDEEDIEFEIYMKEKIAELRGETLPSLQVKPVQIKPELIAAPDVPEKVLAKKEGVMDWIGKNFMQWEFIAIVVTIISGIAAVTGFSISAQKKKKSISKYMTEIDNTFNEFRQKTKRCEAELYRLRDLLEERLKKGKIDESIYELLQKRIDKYLEEITEVK